MKYFKILNADQKIWILPEHNMRMGLMLYQPSAVKGQLFKCFFPYLTWCQLIKKKLHVEEVENPITPELHKKLEQVFGVKKMEFSYFGGTPGVHKKATIQVYNKRKVLGYCKITKSDDIYALFLHEKNILQELEKKHVAGIPRCLYCGVLNDGNYLFVQTTKKTLHSKIEHKLSDFVTTFLTNLWLKTSVKCQFRETDEYRWIVCLEQNMYKLTEYEQKILSKAIVELKDYFGDKEHIFSAYHSDYTPWNMFVEKGELFVFDFEYAGLRYIPYLDIMHHITQTGIFEKDWNANDVYYNYQIEQGSLHSYFNNVRIAYIAYLIDECAKYICREHGTIPIGTQKLLNIWIPLLDKLL